MKKIYLVLLISLLLGFVAGSKAKGQVGCEVCIAPKLCYILTFDLPGCPGNRVVFCYECLVTARIVRVDVAELSTCPGYEDQAWDYFYEWVRNNIGEICVGPVCGSSPPMELYITRPMCAEVLCEGSPRRIIYKAHPGPCDRRCYSKYLRCIDYSQSPPQIVYTLVECRPIGEGSCPPPPDGGYICNDKSPRVITNCGGVPNVDCVPEGNKCK